MNLVIGLTGGIASGKSTASLYIKKNGYKVIDCDKISHDILLKGMSGYDALVSEFGTDILINDIISREKLGNIVFNNKEKLNKLNNILHPLIYKEVESQITTGIVFIDCPLLFETNFINLCDKTLVIYVDKNTQIQRLCERNGFTKEESIKRIELQLSLDEKKDKCDFYVDNCKDIKHLYEQIDELLNNIKE